MISMDYEYLIRAVFKCGRMNRFGANADIFRSLERIFISSLDEKNVDQYLLGVKTGEVAAYLNNALCEVIEQHRDNDDFVSKIEKCKEYLYSPSFKSIYKCIEETWIVFKEIGLIAP